MKVISDKDIYSRVRKYLKDNGVRINDEKHRFEQDKDGTIFIKEWNYSVAVPTEEMLSSVVFLRSIKEEVSKIDILSTLEIDEVIGEDGSIVFNTDTNQLQVFVAGAWKLFSSV